MNDSMRWVAVAFIMGMCASYALWGRRADGVAGTPSPDIQQRQNAGTESPGLHATDAALPRPPSANGPKPVATTGTSALKVFPLQLDLGEVPAGESKTVYVSLENTGTKTVEIKSLAESCGCLKSLMPSRTIAPGGSGKLGVMFAANSSSKRKYSGLYLTAITDEPGSPALRVPVLATVKQEYILEPETVDFGILRKGQSRTREVEISRADGQPFLFRPENISNNGLKSLSFKLGVLKPAPGDSQRALAYKLQVVLDGAQAHSLEGRSLTLVVEDTRPKPLTLLVSGRVAGEVMSVTTHLQRVQQSDNTVPAFDTTLQLVPLEFGRPPLELPEGLRVESVTESDGLPLQFKAVKMNAQSTILNITLQGPYIKNPPTGEFIVKTNADPEPLRIAYSVLLNRKTAVQPRSYNLPNPPRP